MTERSDAAAQVVLARAARDGERVVCAGRIALGAVTLVAWPLFKPALGPSDVVVIAMASLAILAGAVIGARLHNGDPARMTGALANASIAVDVVLVIGAFACFVASPPPHYEGIAREPGIALAYLGILASGLRLQRTGAVLSSALMSAGVGALLVVDAQVNPAFPLAPGNILTIAALLFGASSLALLFASRTRGQVLEGAAAAAREIEGLNTQLRQRVRTRSAELSDALSQLARRRRDDGTLPAGTVFNDRFAIEGFIGAGGMGAVYRAVDRALDQRVAVKVMQARSARELDWQHRFLREALAVATVEHPAIVRMLHVDVTADGVLFQVQELVDGESLEAALQRGVVPAATAARIGQILCEALAAAHAAKILHRDVKPANVMLTSTPPGLKLLDFGVVKLDDDDEDDVVAGTPLYMAPEQRKRGAVVTDRADVYAVGVLLHRAITLSLPDRSATASDASADVYPALARAIAACLLDDATARPSASELATRFATIAAALHAEPLERCARVRARSSSSSGAAPGPLSLLLGEIARPSLVDPPSVSARVGRYTLESRLGGDVWRAHDDKLGRPVALRLCPRDATAAVKHAFAAQAHGAAAVVDPALCLILDVDEHDGAPLIAMELVAGAAIGALSTAASQSSASQSSASQSSASPSSASQRAWLLDVARALARAHAAGVVHGAVRARNVVLTAHGAKLLDLGVVRAVDGDRLIQLRAGPRDFAVDVAAFSALVDAVAPGLLRIDGATPLPAAMADVVAALERAAVTTTG